MGVLAPRGDGVWVGRRQTPFALRGVSGGGGRESCQHGACQAGLITPHFTSLLSASVESHVEEVMPSACTFLGVQQHRAKGAGCQRWAVP